MESSSLPPATAPVAAGGTGLGFGFASKTKKKHFVQQKVKVFLVADRLVGVFLWGFAHWINEVSQVLPPVMLLLGDFKASSKIKVNNHLFHRENLPSHFKFKEYCPQVFRNLRDRFGIDDHDYLMSLTRSPQVKPKAVMAASLSPMTEFWSSKKCPARTLQICTATSTTTTST